MYLRTLGLMFSLLLLCMYSPLDVSVMMKVITDHTQIRLISEIYNGTLLTGVSNNTCYYNPELPSG